MCMHIWRFLSQPLGEGHMVQIMPKTIKNKEGADWHGETALITPQNKSRHAFLDRIPTYLL